MKAGYPGTWSRTFPGVNYAGFYTLNDNAQADAIETLFEAKDIYGDRRYSDSARRGGDFLTGAVARMVDPFQPGRGNELLHVAHNGTRLLVPSIPQLLLRAAHATCKAALKFEDGVPVFAGSIDYGLRDYRTTFDQRGAELFSITQKVFHKRGKRGHAATETAPIRPEIGRLAPCPA